ncbi:MAG: desulfoferrodoxin [Butyricicoccus sp.]|nr:desulfoferrodoxin [Butyricicoccus sp.]MBQ8584867.1 desulfoferrodoxin [Butyricicoccus sp.]
MKVKFYRCAHCGNIIHKIHDAGVPVVCCGQKMEELVPNVVDASGEKHVPVASVEGSVLHVHIGAVDHPMVDAHYIEWVFVELENGHFLKELKPDSDPHVEFQLGENDKPVAVYAYCNLHGLWMSEI